MQRRAFLQSLVGSGVLTQVSSARAEQDAVAPPPVATTHAGPLTFFSVQAAPDLATVSADVVFLGVRSDAGHAGNTGTRLGPNSIREASVIGEGAQPATNDAGFYDWELGARILAGVRLVDAGNLAIPPGAPTVTRERVTAAVATIIGRGAMPIVFGGDHSITFPILRGFRTAPRKVHVIHFNSHHDFGATTGPGDAGGLLYTHGNHLRHGVDLPWVSGITMIGLRGLRRLENAAAEARRRGIQMLSASQVTRMGAEKTVAQIPAAESYYVTFDIDVIDPSLAPGTGTPVPGGFTYYQASELLEAIAAKGHIAGFDMMEVSPPYDFQNTTSRLAGHLIMRFLASVFAARAKGPR